MREEEATGGILSERSLREEEKSKERDSWAEVYSEDLIGSKKKKKMTMSS